MLHHSTADGGWDLVKSECFVIQTPNLSLQLYHQSVPSNYHEMASNTPRDGPISNSENDLEGSNSQDSEDSGSEDLEYDESLKDDLYTALQGIKASGTFAAWGALPTTPPAGLHVEGVGDIPFPIQAATIQQLIAKAHQAPFGRRSETLIDVSVRNTWEIHGDQLRFLDPDWVRFLLDVSERVGADLGIQAPIRLDLYKMLIYEKGAMFKAHTDTEKTPGMFGTLVICLPSAHTGGEVIVKHHGQTKTLRTSDAAQSYACWYSDAMHEVLPVQSGYRCVLTYNLALKPGLTPPVAPPPNYEKEMIQTTLRVWLKKMESDKKERYLYCPLEHEYTEAAISLRALKANDLARAQVMQDLASDLPFDIFLALLVKREDGIPEPDESSYPPPKKRGRHAYIDYDKPDDDVPRKCYGDDTHFLEEVLETHHEVKSLRALDGTPIAHDFDFDVDACLEEDPFDGLNIAEEDYEPYMGNWGPTAIQWYRFAALVIVPHSELGTYLATCGSSNASATIGYLAKFCSLLTAKQHMLDAMSHLCRGQPSRTGLAGVNLANLPANFVDWAMRWLDTRPESERSEHYQNWIPILLPGYPSFSDRIRIIQRLSHPTGNVAPTSSPLALKLTRQSITDFISTLGPPAAEDGNVIVSAVFTLNDSWNNTSALLTSIFDRFSQANAVTFLIQFLSQFKALVRSTSTETFPVASTTVLWKNLSSRFCERNPTSMITSTNATNSSERRVVVTPRALAGFACDLHDLSADGHNLLEPFIQKISSHCSEFSAADMRSFWVPFFSELTRALASRSFPLNTAFYQQLARRLIQRMDDQLVGPCPQPTPSSGGPQQVSCSPSVARTQVSCSCDDCVNLNRFLQDGSKTVARYKFVKARRQHLETIINRSNIPCTHITQLGGSPLTLVVTKSQSLVIQNTLDAWNKRQRHAYTSLLDKIEPEHLKAILGDQESARVCLLARGNVLTSSNRNSLDLT
ncbi:hypothetical protein PCANC_01788 [Puccinia coronata f. sp. avenae]|uniref:Prolyl 4-hydroxylase alpha subunit Fe(2+) 2OG dioxygenase domain-containing protein n=1 Tax=Puccinia coronata f. sp. avenae TaxID=200324 RepID=A0A2N5W580_9BASI|nr:hypothetical protein PCANC_01788 [Puccinia coronata f. sp. avenae]